MAVAEHVPQARSIGDGSTVRALVVGEGELDGVAEVVRKPARILAVDHLQIRVDGIGIEEIDAGVVAARRGCQFIRCDQPLTRRRRPACVDDLQSRSLRPARTVHAACDGEYRVLRTSEGSFDNGLRVLEVRHPVLRMLFQNAAEFGTACVNIPGVAAGPVVFVCKVEFELQFAGDGQRGSELFPVVLRGTLSHAVPGKDDGRIHALIDHGLDLAARFGRRDAAIPIPVRHERIRTRWMEKLPVKIRHSGLSGPKATQHQNCNSE